MMEQLTLEDILTKIYFEGYSHQDLKEYIPLASKNNVEIENFPDTLHSLIGKFSLVNNLNKAKS